MLSLVIQHQTHQGKICSPSLLSWLQLLKNWSLRKSRGGSVRMELHRGRLIDHVQLIVKVLAASRCFYEAVLEVLGVPISGGGDDLFWADEFVVSTKESSAADGKLTGRNHIAFQAADRAMVDAFYKAALQNGGTDNGAG
jgi:hypothetical protein